MWKFDGHERYWHWDADGLIGVTKKTRWIEFPCLKRVKLQHIKMVRHSMDLFKDRSRDLFKDRYCPECLKVATHHEPIAPFRTNEKIVIEHIVSRESHTDVNELDRCRKEVNHRQAEQKEREIIVAFMAWLNDLDTALQTGTVWPGHVVILKRSDQEVDETWKCYAYEDNSPSDPKGFFMRQLEPLLTNVVVGSIGKILSGKKLGETVYNYARGGQHFTIVEIESVSVYSTQPTGKAFEASVNGRLLEVYPGRSSDASELRRNEAVNQVCEFVTDKQDYGKNLGFLARDSGKYGDLSLADDYGDDSKP